MVCNKKERLSFLHFFYVIILLGCDYNLTFELYKHLNTGELKCPSCGATIVPNKEGICQYCRTKVSFTNDKIIMSRNGLL